MWWMVEKLCVSVIADYMSMFSLSSNSSDDFRGLHLDTPLCMKLYLGSQLDCLFVPASDENGGRVSSSSSDRQ